MRGWNDENNSEIVNLELAYESPNPDNLLHVIVVASSTTTVHVHVTTTIYIISRVLRRSVSIIQSNAGDSSSMLQLSATSA